MTGGIINHFSLQPCGEYSNLGEVFEVFIDNKPLLAMITEFEAQYTNTISGSYASILDKTTLLRSLDNKEHGMVPFGCDCGEWQCWFLTGEVNFFQDFVYWGQWKNPFRDDKSKKDKGLYWCYKKFPTLVFDQHQYEQEIKRCLTL